MTTPRSLASAAAMVALLWAPGLAVGARAQPPPPMPGMTDGTMAHPGSSLPFYRERTFLVLVGVGIAAAGVAAYRISGARRRRRPGRTSFVSEAVLVVDLVDSTRLATHYGEGLSRESFAQVGPEGPPTEIPARDRIFMDEEAAKELAGSDIPHRPVGFCSLKGFSGLHRVYEVLWKLPQLEGRP